MIITARDTQVLLCLARYQLLKRPQLQRLSFPSDKDGRITRRRLAALVAEGLLRQHSMRVTSRYDDPPNSVYLLTSRGCRFLAEELQDRRFLAKPVKLPHALHIHHQLAVTELHLILDAAIAAQKAVTLEAWYNEFEVINPSEPDSQQHFRLFTEFSSRPRRICAPDAAFMLGCQGRRQIFYLELDRGFANRGTGSRRLIRQKARGYVELARRGVYRRHFPEATTEGFLVLLIAPDALRRDALLRAFQRKDPAAYGTDVWRFAAMTEIDEEIILKGMIIHGCRKEFPDSSLIAPSH
jgi:hypothetical protein